MKVLVCDDFDFTISLAILSAKRDFLHLDHWLTEKITQHGNRFVGGLIKYLETNLMMGLKQREKAQSKAVLDQSHLNKNSLAVIFDKIIVDKELMVHISAAHRNQASEIYNQLLDYFPDFSRLKSKETEKEANTLLTSYYDGTITVEQLA